jgi:hypothetical protein
MMNIMRFSTCTAANQVRPIAHKNVAAQRFGQRVRHLACLVQVFKFQTHARWAFEPKYLRRIVYMHHRQRRVVFKVARVKRADHGQLLQPWHHASRCNLATGGDQRHLVTSAHTQRTRQLSAKYHAKLATAQALQYCGLRAGCQIGHL